MYTTANHIHLLTHSPTSSQNESHIPTCVFIDPVWTIQLTHLPYAPYLWSSPLATLRRLSNPCRVRASSRPIPNPTYAAFSPLPLSLLCSAAIRANSTCPESGPEGNAFRYRDGDGDGDGDGEGVRGMQRGETSASLVELAGGTGWESVPLGVFPAGRLRRWTGMRSGVWVFGEGEGPRKG